MRELGFDARILSKRLPQYLNITYNEYGAFSNINGCIPCLNLNVRSHIFNKTRNK